MFVLICKRGESFPTLFLGREKYIHFPSERHICIYYFPVGTIKTMTTVCMHIIYEV
eukprot:UN14021